MPRKTRSARGRLGLLHWAGRVVVELRRAGTEFEAEAVHDLRVAIRRCRSMAEGLRTADPAGGWKQLRALAKPLFSALGDLRDTQVMQGWLAAITTEADPARARLMPLLASREEDQKQAARGALKDFNARRWSRLARELDRRARRLPLGGRIFQHLALERWTDAERLHQAALRTHSDADLHQLRIGIKRFRYTVENFLPVHHRRWSKDLKHMQDMLGEVHDLDVLREEVRRLPAEIAVDAALVRIAAERAKRVQEYQAATAGPDGLWTVWRRGLPSGRELSLAANAKIRSFARAADPDPAHSQRVARVAGALWRGVRRELAWPFDRRATVLLRSAALFHNVGAAKSRRKRESVRGRLLGRLSVPIGWTGDEMRLVRLLARYCRGPLPSVADPELSALGASEQTRLMRLAGVLRLADALAKVAAAADVRVATVEHALTILAAGVDPLSPEAAELAGARYLLEVCAAVPVMVRGAARPLASAAHAS
jgi:CHAD domain-containing protein